MATRIYKTPFAATGDKEALATADQPDGKVSLQAGWTPDYELPNDNPNYRPVGRAEMNGIIGEVTEGLGDMQLNGFATWQAIVGGWPVGALVSHGGLKYQSTVASNTATPGVAGSNWSPIVTTVASLPVASTSAAGIVELATNAETQAGADAGRAVTPAGLQSKVQSGRADTTSGRLLAVGAFGVGAYAPSSSVDYSYADDFNLMDGMTSWVSINGTIANGPWGAGPRPYVGVISITVRNGSAAMAVKQQFSGHPDAANGAGDWVRYGTGNLGARVWTEWEQVLTSRTTPSGYMLVAQEAASGVGGGSSVANTFVARALNTVRANTITGASLSSSQITLPAGTYRIRAVAPANGVNLHIARFYNVTDGASVIFGTSENTSSFAATPAETVQTSSIVMGRLVLTSTKVFELRHMCQESVASVGLGSAYGVGGNEVYAMVEIMKEA